MSRRGTLRDAVTSYAERLHAGRTDHHMASPLGAWLLLALAARAVADDDPRRAGLETALGMPVAQAGSWADRVLGEPHPDVHSAVGAWLAEFARAPGVEAWLARLPSGTTHGPVPAKSELDRWTRDHTLDLIEEFPLDVDDDTAVLLATVLATDIDWELPFEEVASERLGGPWATPGATVLTSVDGHLATIARTDHGLVGIHIARSSGGLAVLSVIAEDDAVPPATLRRSAHDLATRDSSEWDRVSLFELPLGDSGVWTVTEQQVVATAPGDQEHLDAVLPAWRATTRIDLMAEPRLGIGTAADSLVDLLPTEHAPYETEGVQVCTASYTRTGFEAAAVSAIGIRATAFSPGTEHRVRRREATIRFGRAYAVVAFTVGSGDEDPWTRLPVFSGWVAQPAYS